MFTAADLPTGVPVALGEGLVLISWWKTLLILPPILGWAWVISSIYDKHAARFFLNRKMWNLIHLVVGLVAVALVLGLPMREAWTFWAGWVGMILLFAADLAAFPLVANKDDRVPAAHRLKLDFSKIAEARAKKAAAKQAGSSTLLLIAADKSALPVPAKDTPEFEARIAGEQLFLRMIDTRAAQLELAPTGKDSAYAASFLVDGLRQADPAIPGAQAQKLIDIWKAGSKLDLNERRKKQQADLTVDFGGTKKKVRVTTIGGSSGQKLTLLMDPEKAVDRKPDDLGLLEPQMAELKAMVEEGDGVVLLAAGSDGGRTTTLYTVVGMHDAYTSNVQTIEFEVQKALEGVKQTKFDPAADGAEFSSVVRSVLRRDPDVVAVAELPDQATAKEISKADQSRTRTYVSIKADNALQAIDLWSKAVGDPEAASKCLRGVVAQKLMRKLCVNCRVPYAPTADMLKKLGLPADKVKQLYKKGGQVLVKNKPETCNVCSGGGYIGQDAAFEIFRLGEEERTLIAAGNLAGLRAELRKKNQPTIQQAALRKAVDGFTSVEEVTRVTAEPARPAAAPNAAAKSAPAKPKA